MMASPRADKIDTVDVTDVSAKCFATEIAAEKYFKERQNECGDRGGDFGTNVVINGVPENVTNKPREWKKAIETHATRQLDAEEEEKKREREEAARRQREALEEERKAAQKLLDKPVQELTPAEFAERMRLKRLEREQSKMDKQEAASS